MRLVHILFGLMVLNTCFAHEKVPLGDLYSIPKYISTSSGKKLIYTKKSELILRDDQKIDSQSDYKVIYDAISKWLYGVSENQLKISDEVHIQIIKWFISSILDENSFSQQLISHLCRLKGGEKNYILLLHKLNLILKIRMGLDNFPPQKEQLIVKNLTEEIEVSVFKELIDEYRKFLIDDLDKNKLHLEDYLIKFSEDEKNNHLPNKCAQFIRDVKFILAPNNYEYFIEKIFRTTDKKLKTFKDFKSNDLDGSRLSFSKLSWILSGVSIAIQIGAMSVYGDGNQILETSFSFPFEIYTIWNSAFLGINSYFMGPKVLKKLENNLENSYREYLQIENTKQHILKHCEFLF
ncbi:MAG: hypothetical protein H6622_01730 [Halobacteriovoraceae bacterium]|nr:hypothetical protein [Halobacteriovoraceae bacterium]